MLSWAVLLLHIMLAGINYVNPFSWVLSWNWNIKDGLFILQDRSPRGFYLFTILDWASSQHGCWSPRQSFPGRRMQKLTYLLRTGLRSPRISLPPHSIGQSMSQGHPSFKREKETLPPKCKEHQVHLGRKVWLVAIFRDYYRNKRTACWLFLSPSPLLTSHGGTKQTFLFPSSLSPCTSIYVRDISACVFYVDFAEVVVLQTPISSMHS